LKVAPTALTSDVSGGVGNRETSKLQATANLSVLAQRPQFSTPLPEHPGQFFFASLDAPDFQKSCQQPKHN
jgi:hypothetical protein